MSGQYKRKTDMKRMFLYLTLASMVMLGTATSAEGAKNISTASERAWAHLHGLIRADAIAPDRMSDDAGQPIKQLQGAPWDDPFVPVDDGWSELVLGGSPRQVSCNLLIQRQSQPDRLPSGGQESAWDDDPQVHSLWRGRFAVVVGDAWDVIEPDPMGHDAGRQWSVQTVSLPDVATLFLMATGSMVIFRTRSSSADTANLD